MVYFNIFQCGFEQFDLDSLDFWWVHHGVFFRCIGRHHRNITTHVPTQTYSKLDLGIDQLSWISLTDSSNSWTEMVGNKRLQGLLTSHEWTLPVIFVSHCGGLWYSKTGIRSSGIIQHGPNDFPSIAATIRTQSWHPIPAPLAGLESQTHSKTYRRRPTQCPKRSTTQMKIVHHVHHCKRM